VVVAVEEGVPWPAMCSPRSAQSRSAGRPEAAILLAHAGDIPLEAQGYRAAGFQGGSS
jgi:hypothetical protein